MINDIVGNIALARKNWERYMVIETAKKEITHRKNKDGKAVASLLKVIMETRILNKEDADNYLDKMIPFESEITHDPVVLGEDIEIIDNIEQCRTELRQLFNKREVCDADIIEDEETV